MKGMRMEETHNWFHRAKIIVVEATALLSLTLIAAAMILSEIKHLF